MKEIKFRAWDQNWLRYVADGWKIDNLGRINLHKGLTPIEDTDYILEQFTGLHDKNGKEIYEGDIIKDNIHADLMVIWDKEYASFRAKNKTVSYGLSIVGSVEVIGNIHENPERLK